MQAGRLNKRVTIEEPLTTKNSYGESTTVWSPFAPKRWASVEPVSANEYFSSGEVQARATHRVKVRYLAGVTPAMRLDYEGRTLQIVGVVDPFEKHEELIIFCEEQVT